MSDSSITTTGSGANGAFATGEGASVSLTNATIEATGRGGHGVMATQGGSVTLDNVKITTGGANAAPLATDRGGGTITATGGSALASGKDSPALYSTGTIAVNGGTYEATGAEAAVIEGSNSIGLTDVVLSSTIADKWGVMLYQSMSGDAEGTTGTFTMTGGSLKVTGENSPVFYVTNCTGTIVLEGVDITSHSGVLVDAAAGNWGTSGSNGGTAILSATGQTLGGDLVADSSSSLSIDLINGSRLDRRHQRRQHGQTRRSDHRRRQLLHRDRRHLPDEHHASPAVSPAPRSPPSSATATRSTTSHRCSERRPRRADLHAERRRHAAAPQLGGGRPVASPPDGATHARSAMHGRIVSTSLPTWHIRPVGLPPKKEDHMTEQTNPRVLLSTSLGDITLELDAGQGPGDHEELPGLCRRQASSTAPSSIA